jgi:hypothetical protein
MEELGKSAFSDRSFAPGVPTEIVKRQVAPFCRADPDYGIGVAAHMGACRE